MVALASTPRRHVTRWLDVLADGTALVADVYDGELFLWERTGGWAQLALPSEVGATGLGTLAIATFGAVALLVWYDGTTGTIQFQQGVVS